MEQEILDKKFEVGDNDEVDGATLIAIQQQLRLWNRRKEMY